MASEAFPNYIKGIREARFGLDARDPIVKAIEDVASTNDYSLVDSVEAVLDTSHVDWIEIVERVIPVPATEYSGDSSDSTGLSIKEISNDDFLLTDTRGEDSAELISGTTDDYILMLRDSKWDTTGLIPSSYIEYEEVPHYETYTLTFNLAKA